MQYFDCNTWVGKRCTPTPHDVHSSLQTVELLRKNHIEKAFAAHFSSLEYHAAYGNQLVLEECASFPEVLFPVWVLLPEAVHDFPSGGALREALLSHSIRLARIYPHPARHNFSISDWCCGSLLSQLEQLRIPLLLDADQLTWDQLKTVLQTHPRLNIILSALNYRMERYLYPLLAAHGNLYLETSGLKGFLSIETICASFGAARLVFGSGSPVFDCGASTAIIELADISPADKQAIARENLLALTGL